jgi:glycosyltransferase involved in cell wall biosynthesis/CDP-glycerol glycerophosphotransferase (TagB/SpsB family)
MIARRFWGTSNQPDGSAHGVGQTHEGTLVGDGSISVVMPTYNVGPYLPEFLASIDKHRSDLSHIEFIFVDDGSPDDSAAIIQDWMKRRPKLTTRLVRKENGGLASARNAGLDVATGEWVTFCDPDDVFSDDYLGVMSRFVRSKKAETVHIVAGRFIYLNEDTGKTSDSHPLRFRFEEGTRVWDLGRHPHFIHVAANTGLFRRAVIEKYGLRYDPTVRPVWEDGHLTVRYLSKFERPRIAMMADAIYYYRRRSDGSSLMDGQWTSTGKFIDVPRNGWLDSLRVAASEHDGQVPPWIQNMIIYDIIGYFKQERRSPSPTGNTPREVSDEFFSILREIMTYIDLDVLDGFRVNYVPFEIRKALRMYFKGCEPRPEEIFLDQLDRDRGLVRLHWYYSGEAPSEDFRARGFRVAPVFAKTRPCSFYGRTLMYERVVWLPSNGALSVALDGVPTPLRIGPMEIRRMAIGPRAIWTGLAGETAEEQPMPIPAGLRPKAGRAKREILQRVDKVRSPDEQLRRKAQRVLRTSRSKLYRLKYRKAWLFIDRDTQAQDNAEHLYRYVRANHRRVNAWFVLSRASSDWDRLAAEGFRLIEYGTREYQIALLNCEHVLSSQIDNYITAPLSKWRFGEENVNTWHYTFLQHGVTKDDLSIWINPKPIDLMITATPDEHHSIVDDSSPYIWGDREVKMTGFPRHDRLLALAQGPQGRNPNLILVMPTWRRELVLDTVAGGNDRELRDDFWDSEYAVQWRAVIESEQLHKLADDHGYKMVFIPHPNMQRYLDNSPLAEHVEVHRFREIDIQEMLARGAALITDYSSMGFETAYLQRPVVYFQFDQEAFFSGGHAYRKGTWDYEKDGFGPVALDTETAIAEIAEVIRRSCAPAPLYAERMANAFPFRDGRCSQRTYEAAVDMTRRLKYDELYRKIDPPEVLEGRPVMDELGG